ncbi:chemotaxis protein CheA, partial [Vibrio parahaemolyticus]|nr:chemotaxis protein CheA [Vibrio parahaemolyticus]
PKAAEPSAPVSSSSNQDSDLMTDEEFEKLLDELHGSGKGPTLEELDMATKPASANVEQSPAKPEPAIKPAPAAPTPAPAPKPESKPVAVKEEAKAPAVKKPQAEAT